MKKFKNAEPPDEQDLIGTFLRFDKCNMMLNGKMREIDITKDFAVQINDICKTQAKPL